MKNIVSPARFSSSSTAIIPSSIALLVLLPAAAASAAWPSSQSVLATIRQQTASAAAASRGGRGRALFGTYYNNNNKMELFPIQRARALQATGGGDMCAPIDVFDDDDALQAFDTSFSPVCTCDRGDSLVNITKYFDENPVPTDSSLLDQWIEDLNDYGRSLVFDEQVSCRNECSVCTSCNVCTSVSEDSPCLILEQSEGRMFRGSLNLSKDYFLRIGYLPEQELPDVVSGQSLVFLDKSFFMTCYMPEGSSSGKVCRLMTADFSSDVGSSGFEVAAATAYGCAVSVDGVDCTSCSVDTTTGCVAADCTNMAGDSSAMIDICNKDRASFPGVFGPLYDFEQVEDYVTYTLGRCDVGGSSSTPPPPLTPPKAAPVAMPVAVSAPTPVIGPVSSPASAPVSSPVSLPGSAPVSAPASAPEPAPISSTVTSPNSAPVLSPLPPIVPAAADSGATEYYYGGGRSVLTLVLVWAVAAIMFS